MVITNLNVVFHHFLLAFKDYFSFRSTSVNFICKQNTSEKKTPENLFRYSNSIFQVNKLTVGFSTKRAAIYRTDKTFCGRSSIFNR